MGLLDKLKGKTAPPVAAPPAAAPASGGISFEKVTGKISLDKNRGPVMIKGSAAKVTASWSSKTDYDLYGYLVLRTGEVVPIATYAAGKVEPVRERWTGQGSVIHRGDVGREASGTATETIDIVMGDDVCAFVPIGYSAQSNGSGSFKRYKVGMTIDNGAGDVVTIDAKHASDNDYVYTVAIGIIYNQPGGIGVQRLERYSTGGENRPTVSLLPDGTVEVVMDTGPRNDHK